MAVIKLKDKPSTAGSMCRRVAKGNTSVQIDSEFRELPPSTRAKEQRAIVSLFAVAEYGNLDTAHGCSLGWIHKVDET